jgi:hypothetical protein
MQTNHTFNAAGGGTSRLAAVEDMGATSGNDRADDR